MSWTNFFKKMVFYRWGYRYPNFLRNLKSDFCAVTSHCKFYFDEFNMCEWWDLLSVQRTEKGKTETIKVEFNWDESTDYPIVICGIPDGNYRVENAYNEDGKPFHVSVKNGSFNDREMAIAGAYMWWCVQSSNPTGHTTVHLDVEEDHSRYYEGLCGELYHGHNTVTDMNFDIEKKSVSLRTCLQL